MIITVFSIVAILMLALCIELAIKRDKFLGELRFYYLFVVFLIIPLSTVFIVQIRVDRDYEIRKFERDMLVEAYDAGNDYIYVSVVEFNKELEKEKRWADSPWVDWFINQRIVEEIDYIGVYD